MFAHFSTNQKGMLIGLAGYTSFSFSDPVAKFLSPHYPPLQLACIGSGLAALLLLVFTKYLGGWDGWSAKKEIRIHILRTALNIIINLLLLYSFTVLSLANIYAMIFAMPFFAVLLAIVFYHEVVTPSRWISIAIGFAGVLIILQPTPASFQATLLIPLLISFLIAIIFLTSRSLKQASPFIMGFYPLAGTSLFCLPFIFIGTPDFQLLANAGVLQVTQSAPILWQHIPLFLMVGSFTSIGILGLSLAFRLASASLVSPFLYSQMIWGILFGYLIFDDVPSAVTLLGSGVIIGSGLYLILMERQANRSALN